MMKRLMQITLAAAIAVSLALAEERQPGSGFDLPARFFLLTQKSVQKELKLTDEQIEKITALQEKHRDDRSKAKGLKGEELRKNIAERVKAENELIDNVLKPEQFKRFRQISLQWHLRALPFTLTREEIAKALQITDEQKKKIEEIQAEATKGFLGAGRLNEEGFKKIETVRKETNAKTMGVLTAEQKTILKEMIGEPFKGKIARPIRSSSENQKNPDSQK